MEKVLRKFKDIPQNDIIEKFKMNEEIMNNEFSIFLLVKVILLYLVPMLLTFLLSMIGTALMTICYFIIFSFLYCFYCFIKIEDNKLNATYYISIYLLQHLLFIFLVIYL